jgi:transposase InsO family protein
LDDVSPNYLVFDNDTRPRAGFAGQALVNRRFTATKSQALGKLRLPAIFSREVTESIQSIGIMPKRTAYRSPWQNGTAERWVGSCKRELIDHVIVLNEEHLRRILRDYVRATTTRTGSTLPFETRPRAEQLRAALYLTRKLWGFRVSAAFTIDTSGRKSPKKFRLLQLMGRSATADRF